MAKNANITAQASGSMVGLDNTIQVFQRVIDCSKQNLASGDHFELFTIPAASIVLTGWSEILTADSGGGAFTVGIGGTGHEIVNSTNVNATASAAIDHVAVSFATADTIDLAAATAALTTAKIRITLVVCSFTRAASASQSNV